MHRREVSPDVASSLVSIKTVVAIVNGLTFTNTLLVLITGGHYSRVIPVGRLRIIDVAFAVVLIANIVRFYHGNVRHLDSAYGYESYSHAASGRHAEPRGGLGVDFFVVFGQSLMFSAASFYIGSHAAFLAIFILLLFFDVVWTVYSQQEMPSASPQRSWLLNNIGALAALVCLHLFHLAHPAQSWPLDASLGILALTTAIDFWLSWGFYFPATRRSLRDGNSAKARDVFLSAPFTQFLVTKDDDTKEAFAASWSALADALEIAGHRVFSAHRREAWGANLYPPEVALPTDLQNLRESDLVVAYIGAPPSPGVQLEIGYAIAIQLPMLIFIDRGQTEPYLVRGVPTASAGEDVEIVEIDSLDEIAESLAQRGLIPYHLTRDAGSPRGPNGHRRLRWRSDVGDRA